MILSFNLFIGIYIDESTTSRSIVDYTVYNIYTVYNGKCKAFDIGELLRPKEYLVFHLNTPKENLILNILQPGETIFLIWQLWLTSVAPSVEISTDYDLELEK
jgi:restriction endonuclease S subunit